MPYQLNLLGKKKIFINSNYLRNSAFSSKSLSCVQTIATIPVDQPPYSMISYVSVSDLEKNIIFGGRLAEYKYYDMHQVIESALKKVNEII
jgi:UDP-galactopyranose mutase